MYLVAGLGNPGKQYEHTRHNAGFDTVDEIASLTNARYWKAEGGAVTAKVMWKGNDILLAKPQSFMNASGGPIRSLINSYGISADDLIVIHDDLDIEPGHIRVKFGGGLAGHNGLKSIFDKLGTKDWYRVRIGIGRPPGRMPVIDYVLSAPKKEAKEEFEAAIDLGAQATLYLIENGLEKTQQEYN
ncbi:MAG: aminoacyl-tRNA hydrolase [Eggerthellaceae bacterium]|nr:aminoacyl-tRNA hydrolase [Eggerthellaceae bacterium]